MSKNIKDRIEFKRRIEILWDEDYWDRELEEFPSSVLGGFYRDRISAILKLHKLHPEYHIVTCIEPDLYVNRFVPNGQAYYLAEGDSDPSLVHDLYDKLDAHYFHTLNSGLSKFSA